jgi:4-hydroxy-tetrahydrodipicolinate reductase
MSDKALSKEIAMAGIKIVVTGAAGRMGRVLVKLLLEDPAFELIGGTEALGHVALGEDLGALAGTPTIGLALTHDLLDLVRRADAVLDFSTPSHSLEVAALSAQARIVHVLGTTGFAAADETKLRAAARHAVIVRSGNFSIGVILMAALARRMARTLDDSFDVEILEMHHRMKLDAPSGTALLLGEAVAEGRGVELAPRRGPDGQAGPRARGSIGFSSLRGGAVVGEHTVIFAGDDERLELTHKAADRSIFARGALRAAKWGQGRAPGLYSMEDVLGLSD